MFRRLIQSPKRIVGPYINSGDTVIDIGCGPGFFTIPMADMVGGDGSVIAIDLQPEMLEKIARKLRNSPLLSRVTLHNCGPDSLGLDSSIQADFILAYYMVHETPDQSAFLKQVRQHLKKQGRLLVVEPPFHVSKKAFAESMETAQRIFELAKDLNLRNVAVVGNKIQNPSQKDFLMKSLPKAEFLGFIPYDEAIINADLANRSVLNSSQPVLFEVKKIYSSLVSSTKTQLNNVK